MTSSRVLLALLLGCTLPACSALHVLDKFSKPTVPAVSNEESAEQLYQKAKNELNHKNYRGAIELYETLEARYPFGQHAQQAQLETAYAYYKDDEADSAIANADRFIRLNPNHPHVDYAYYLKGLANFNRTNGLLGALIRRDRADKDPEPLRKSFDDFKTLVTNYPDSRYAEDARIRMVYLRNVLAEHEMKIADYYMRRGAWVAALNRSKYVVENLEGSQSVPKALSIEVTAYRKLGLNELADDTLRVLKLNYPNQSVKDLEKKG